jgi:ubiquinol-cytochrome c reductase cytochrome b subunit
MPKSLRRIIDWLEHRTGLESAIRNFLYEDIPASSGWHQVIGSIALFSFMIQVVTGILLAFNYAPTPGEAYNSLKYIVEELTAGSLIRGLHHWGASLMIIIVALHMVQVFLYGAYKKPREATWMVGVILLLITLGFGLTGYLLPWDNRAYWGTVVTTQIAATAPIMGPYLTRLMGGEGSIGVVTFARFYALHVLLLPPLTMLLIAIHVYLVRKHGVAPAADDTAPRKKFFPEQVFKDTVGIFVAFMILFIMAAAVRVPLGKLADPTDTVYIPRPEWYFLFLFQMLKVFEGPLEVVGTIVLPTLAILALFLIPFVDRGPMIRLGKRTFAFAFVLLAAVGWGGLTMGAIATTPKSAEAEEGTAPAVAGGWRRLTPVELAGVGYFRQQNCRICHAPAGEKGVGPDLTRMPAAHRNAAWMVPHFKQPSAMVPGSAMPPVQLSTPQLNALAALLMKLDPTTEQGFLAAPDFAAQGAMVYEANRCGSCHQINGAGMKLGPPLNGVSSRHDRAWLEAHFLNPQSMVKDSFMPAYKFNAKDMDAICRYLLAL